MPTKIFKGWQAKIFINDLEIGCCKNVNITYESSVEPYYSIDDPNMYQVTSVDQLGLVSISGTLNRAWVNPYYLRLLFGGNVPIIPNTEFDMVLQASEEAGSPMLYLYNCRFTKGTINIPANGWLEESYDFIALRASTKEVIICPSGEQIINGGFETSDFTGWSAASNWHIDFWSGGHSGSCFAYSDYGSGTLEQDFENPIPGECFTTFEVWGKGTYQGGCGQDEFGEMYIDILYTDDTYTRIDWTVLSAGWSLINLKASLVTSKTVKGIRFIRVAYYVGVDDCSAVC